MSVRHSNPIAIHNKPQVSLLPAPPNLSGEEELIDALDRSCEHPCAPVEGPAHIHQHLLVLDSVHFARQGAGVGSEEVHFASFHCERKEDGTMMVQSIYNPSIRNVSDLFLQN